MQAFGAICTCELSSSNVVTDDRILTNGECVLVSCMLHLECEGKRGNKEGCQGTEKERERRNNQKES